MAAEAPKWGIPDDKFEKHTPPNIPAMYTIRRRFDPNVNSTALPKK